MNTVLMKYNELDWKISISIENYEKEGSIDLTHFLDVLNQILQDLIQTTNLEKYKLNHPIAKRVIRGYYKIFFSVEVWISDWTKPTTKQSNEVMAICANLMADLKSELDYKYIPFEDYYKANKEYINPISPEEMLEIKEDAVVAPFAYDVTGFKVTKDKYTKLKLKTKQKDG